MESNSLPDKEIDRRLSVLMKLYEVNYDYQNQKEQRLWLLFSAYITILLAAVGWAISNESVLNSRWGMLALTSILLLFSLFAIAYITHQNWLKAWSVERDYRMLEKMRLFDSQTKPTYDQILNAAYPPANDPINRQKGRIFVENGLSGVIILIILILISLVQMSLILFLLGKFLLHSAWRLWF